MVDQQILILCLVCFYVASALYLFINPLSLRKPFSVSMDSVIGSLGLWELEALIVSLFGLLR